MFDMILNATLCVQYFCSFSAILLIVNLLIKMYSTIICVSRMLELVCCQPFFIKKALQIWKISYVNWLNFVYCLKFRSLRPDQANECKFKTKLLGTHILGTCAQNFIPLAQKTTEKNEVFYLQVFQVLV